MNDFTIASTKFNALIAHNLHKIIASFARDTKETQPDQVISNGIGSITNETFLAREITLSLERKVFEIDATDAEMVGRALFVSNGVALEETQWWVFAVADHNDENLYTLTYQLDQAVNAHHFVAECYKIFLERSADDEGLMVYESLLLSNTLSQRDLMRILLTSTEGLKLENRLIVVQYPRNELLSFVADPHQYKFLKLKSEFRNAP